VCHQELQATMQVTLLADSVTLEGDTISYVQWDSVAFNGVGNNVGLKGKLLKTMSLELRPDTTMTQYLIQYHGQVDTLFIEHTPRLQYISAACGCAIYHTILGAWSSDPRVDSVSIINANVESFAQDNLCIHMHE
jgi:hypothetical protein